MNLGIKERHSDMGLVDKLFGSYSAKELKRIRPQVEAVLGLEEHYRAMDNRTLQGETARLKGLLAQGKTLEDILPEAEKPSGMDTDPDQIAAIRRMLGG